MSRKKLIIIAAALVILAVVAVIVIRRRRGVTSNPSGNAESGKELAPMPECNVGDTLYVKLNDPTSHLHLRQSPNMSAAILARMPHGTALTVAEGGTDGKWINVIYNGQTGYAYGSYLSETQL